MLVIRQVRGGDDISYEDYWREVWFWDVRRGERVEADTRY